MLWYCGGPISRRLKPKTSELELKLQIIRVFFNSLPLVWQGLNAKVPTSQSWPNPHSHYLQCWSASKSRNPEHKRKAKTPKKTNSFVDSHSCYRSVSNSTMRFGPTLMSSARLLQEWPMQRPLQPYNKQFCVRDTIRLLCGWPVGHSLPCQSNLKNRLRSGRDTLTCTNIILERTNIIIPIGWACNWKDEHSPPPHDEVWWGSAVAAKGCSSATPNLLVDIWLAVLATGPSGSIDDVLRQSWPWSYWQIQFIPHDTLPWLP